ncbi:MAG: Rid family detoxifying hydrolase [Acidimicrobiia bacterium]|nr:Rid family detoxifying hydrolase [Acidimicrobiia bacterium]
MEGAPPPLAPYSVVTEAQGLVFVSGQIAIHPTTGETPDAVTDQTQLILHNIGNILGELGLTYSDIVKTTVFLTDIRDFGAVNAVYASFFDDEPPARSAVGVAALPLAGLKIEIEAIAAR